MLGKSLQDTIDQESFIDAAKEGNYLKLSMIWDKADKSLREVLLPAKNPVALVEAVLNMPVISKTKMPESTVDKMLKTFITNDDNRDQIIEGIFTDHHLNTIYNSCPDKIESLIGLVTNPTVKLRLSSKYRDFVKGIVNFHKEQLQESSRIASQNLDVYEAISFILKQPALLNHEILSAKSAVIESCDGASISVKNTQSELADAYKELMAAQMLHERLQRSIKSDPATPKCDAPVFSESPLDKATSSSSLSSSAPPSTDPEPAAVQVTATSPRSTSKRPRDDDVEGSVDTSAASQVKRSREGDQDSPGLL